MSENIDKLVEHYFEPKEKINMKTLVKEELVKSLENNVKFSPDAITKLNMNESLKENLGMMVQKLVADMMNGNKPNIKLKGKKEQVETFYKCLQGEVNLLQLIQQYGIENPQTIKAQKEMDNLVGQFQNATGLEWPFQS